MTDVDQHFRDGAHHRCNFSRRYLDDMRATLPRSGQFDSIGILESRLSPTYPSSPAQIREMINASYFEGSGSVPALDPAAACPHCPVGL